MEACRTWSHQDWLQFVVSPSDRSIGCACSTGCTRNQTSLSAWCEPGGSSDDTAVHGRADMGAEIPGAGRDIGPRLRSGARAGPRRGGARTSVGRADRRSGRFGGAARLHRGPAQAQSVGVRSPGSDAGCRRRHAGCISGAQDDPRLCRGGGPTEQAQRGQRRDRAGRHRGRGQERCRADAARPRADVRRHGHGAAASCGCQAGAAGRATATATAGRRGAGCRRHSARADGAAGACDSRCTAPGRRTECRCSDPAARGASDLSTRSAGDRRRSDHDGAATGGSDAIRTRSGAGRRAVVCHCHLGAACDAGAGQQSRCERRGLGAATDRDPAPESSAQSVADAAARAAAGTAARLSERWGSLSFTTRRRGPVVGRTRKRRRDRRRRLAGCAYGRDAGR